MKNLLYILLTMVLLSITSCHKEDKEFVITGQIIKDCSGEPLANFNIEGWLDCDEPFSKCVEVFAATTDANGNFSMIITRKGGLEISTPGNGFPFLSDIPVISSVSIGSFMAEPTTSFVYRIKVNNPYNVGDTLYANLRSTFTLSHIVIPAPLQDTLFSIKTFTGGNTYPVLDFIPIKLDMA
ncbi:MAG: DUF4198 domain-containing protein [Vicingaceae bacterium]|nr:DUF4198 domain-containing protein [Vicingaceae bacterium]